MVLLLKVSTRQGGAKPRMSCGKSLCPGAEHLHRSYGKRRFSLRTAKAMTTCSAVLIGAENLNGKLRWAKSEKGKMRRRPVAIPHRSPTASWSSHISRAEI